MIRRTQAKMPGTLSLCRRLCGLLDRSGRKWILAGVAIAIASTLSGIGLLAVSGHFITDMALVGVSGAAINYYTPAALIRLFAILRTGGRYTERLITHEATLRVLARLRVWLFGRLVPLAPARLGQLRSAELFSRLRGDVDALEHAYLGVLMPLVVAVIVALVTLSIAFLYLPMLGYVLALSFVAGGVWLPSWTLRRAKIPGAAIVTCTETMRALVADGLQGRAELMLYGAEPAHAARMAETAGRLRHARRRMDALQAAGGAGVALTTQLAVIGALRLGLQAMHFDRLAGPDLTMLALLIMAAFETIAPLPDAWAQLGVTLTCARRIFALADMPPAVVEPCATSPVIHDGSLAIRQLRMRYDPAGPWVLDGVNLDLPQGRRLALVGPSGAGKSSLINALLRFYPYEGSIMLGGTSLDAWRGDDVRARIAVVDQHPYLFDASLRDNLRLARPEATDEQLTKVIGQAQLDSYVASLPQGLNTWVGENGVRVSGGEARRIAIARALLMDAPILLLDEPTEGLDAGTAAQLYQALAVAMTGRSVLLITHRMGGLSTLIDEVATMEKGRVLQQVSMKAYLEGRSEPKRAFVADTCHA